MVDIDKIIPDKEKSIYKGGVLPLGKYKNNLFFWQLEAIAKKFDFSIKAPISLIPKEALDIILQKYQPQLWYFGHFHKHNSGFDSDYNCRWHALNMMPHTCWFEKLI